MRCIRLTALILTLTATTLAISICHCDEDTDEFVYGDFTEACCGVQTEMVDLSIYFTSNSDACYAPDNNLNLDLFTSCCNLFGYNGYQNIVCNSPS